MPRMEVFYFDFFCFVLFFISTIVNETLTSISCWYRCGFTSKQGRCFSSCWKWAARHFPHIGLCFSNTLWITNWSLQTPPPNRKHSSEMSVTHTSLSDSMKRKGQEEEKQQTMIFQLIYKELNFCSLIFFRSRGKNGNAIWKENVCFMFKS